MSIPMESRVSLADKILDRKRQIVDGRDMSSQTPLSYFLNLLTEEMSEVGQGIGKAGRFGMDTPGIKDPFTGEVRMDITPRTYIAKELGDVIAAIQYGIVRGLIDEELVIDAAESKIAKLLDPTSLDNLGRKLAP